MGSIEEDAKHCVAPMRPLHVVTPLIRSETMTRILGVPVWLKMDCMQPPGSFKLRGVGLKVSRAVEAGCEHVISSSGGNAGLATAYAGRALGVPVTVVLPSTTPDSILDRLRSYGAEALVHGSVWDEANTKAEELVASGRDKKAVLVHPFDDAELWAGHSSLVAEVRGQLEAAGETEAPGAFVTVVGGGGLLMGILEGLQSAGPGWSDVPVVACETEGAASMARSLEAGKLVTLPGIDSVAKSLGAATVSDTIFQHCLPLSATGKVRPWVTTDQAAVRACARFADEHRVLVEPACGAGLAAVYEGSAALKGVKGSVIVQVCGGGIVTRSILQSYCDQLGVSESWA